MVDFLGIGAQKCGTTWLFENLKKHPRIHFPLGIKEHHFWDRYNPNDSTALHHYKRCFKKKFFRLQGEITPAYALLEKDTIQRIYNLYPKLKLFYIIRDPVERAWSAALMALTRAEMTFEEASDGWFLDHFHSQGSLRRGNYRSCLHNWLSIFPPEQFCILDYEDIRSAPVNLLQHCCRHLGIDPSFFTHETVIHEKVFPGPNQVIRPALKQKLTQLYDGGMHSPLELLPMAPIVIGGSGTPSIHPILQQAGVFMGKDYNDTGDALTFEPLLDQYINPILQETATLNYSVSDCSQILQDAVLFSLKTTALHFMQHAPLSTVRWGWKNPRSMYLLPFIHRLFPKMYFIHVVRDGRDVALSKNQNECNNHYAAYFGIPFNKADLPQASIALWSKINLDTATWALQYLGSHYIRIHFERLCEYPKETITSLLEQLDIPTNATLIDNLASLVIPPETLSRWKSVDPQYIKQLELCGEEGLDYFKFL